ncbi:MAG: DUF3696 domain-containing protein [Marinifilaceae bacterium]
MISEIQLKNFKIFKEETKFPLSSINLVTGINGRGKSSFLQSLLLFNQTQNSRGGLEDKLILNGECIHIGTFNDLRNSSVSEESSIDIQLTCNENQIILELGVAEDDDMVAKITNGSLSNFHFLEKLHYIAADRVGPQEFYLRANQPSFISVGSKGQFVGNVLYSKRDELINEELYIGNKTQELLIQTGEWIGEILDAPGLRVDVNNIGNGVLILSFQFGNNEKKYKPSNVGFGYSYILPIVVSGLIAKPGEIIIVENPEAHLHPKAQSYLVEFLSKVAMCGVQVFIESHSEHILNALRVLITSESSKLKSDDVSVLYFNNGEGERVQPIQINQGGAIDLWPVDFFDQAKKDLEKILKF